MQLGRTRSKSPSKPRADGATFAALEERELYELISLRAHELYLQRGTAAGDELTDWLRAETDVLATISALSSRAKKPFQKIVKKPRSLPGQRSTGVRPRSTSRKAKVQDGAQNNTR